MNNTEAITVQVNASTTVIYRAIAVPSIEIDNVTADDKAPPLTPSSRNISSSIAKNTDPESMTGNGKDYRGFQTMTVGGYKCQAWTDQFPKKHTRTPQKYPDAGLEDGAYCRNPDGGDTIWCYTLSSRRRWDHCKPITIEPLKPHSGSLMRPLAAQTPPSASNPEALDGPNGPAGYRGFQNRTRSGKKCKEWDDEQSYVIGPMTQNFPFAGLENNNYCRFPQYRGRSQQGQTTIWCFWEGNGGDPTKPTWEYCDPLPSSDINATKPTSNATWILQNPEVNATFQIDGENEISM